VTLFPLDLAHLDGTSEALRAAFQEIEQRVDALPRLNKILSEPQEEILQMQLDERAAVLGSAMLPPASILLLKRLLHEKELRMAAQIHGPHDPTYHAWEKQSLLPRGTYVQKTTTLRLGGKLFLVCSIGDQHFGEHEQALLATYLGLSRSAARQATFNPKDFTAAEYGLFPGIVSPFLPFGAEKPLYAVVQLAWPAAWNERNVGVSVSLCETVSIPLSDYGGILCSYLPQSLPIYFLDQTEEIVATTGRRQSTEINVDLATEGLTAFDPRL
jgi:hypothetical protein